MKHDTTIRIKIETRNEINALKSHRRQSSDEIVNSLLDNFRKKNAGKI